MVGNIPCLACRMCLQRVLSCKVEDYVTPEVAESLALHLFDERSEVVKERVVVSYKEEGADKCVAFHLSSYL